MAGKSAGFAIGISIQDGASAGLDAINKRIAALTAPSERFNKSLAKFGEVTGINRAAEGMQTLGDRTLAAARAAERLAGPMAGITGAASLGGVLELNRRWADAGNTISKTSNLLNMPVDRLSALRGAARLAGSSTDAMDASMKGLSETLHAAFYTRDPGAQMHLKALGIDWQDAQGNITKTEDALGKLADKVSTYKDPATQGRALEAVGVDKDLLPLLDKGQAGLDALVRRAQQTGGVMTAEMAANAKAMNSSWNELGLAVEGVSNRIVDSWSGTATKVLDTTSHWIENNKELADSYTKIGTSIVGAFTLWKAAGYLPWMVRALGLAVVGEELIYQGTRIGGTNESPDELERMRRETHYDPPIGIEGGTSRGEDPGPTAYNKVSLDRAKMALLNTIAAPESSGRYDLKNGGAAFSGYGSFPDYVGRGGTSTASGKYQFTAGTWKEAAAALGLTDFSPENQDKAAWWLADRTYRQNVHRDLASDLAAGGHEADIAGALRGRWPSLPGGSQQLETQAQFDRLLHSNQYDGSRSSLPDPGLSADGKPGHVRVDVHLHGAAAGTTASATATGPVTVGAPRVETSMAFAR